MISFQSSRPSPLQTYGPQTVHGSYAVQGSKNSALPIIAASLLSREPITLNNVPRLSDIEVLLDLLASLGTHVSWTGSNTVTLHTPEILSVDAPYELVSKMRASFLVMGPLIARSGKASVSMPGGCAFGTRPIDQHLKAFRAFGLELTDHAGHFQALRHGPPRGEYTFEMPTVGGTQNALMCAVLGSSEVTLHNASVDTDVNELVRFLRLLGADIRGYGTTTLQVHGVKALYGGTYTIIPDRIEAGTLLLLAAATRSALTLKQVNPAHLRAVTQTLREMNVRVQESDTTLKIDARVGELRPTSVATSAFPGFPTDLQPQLCALMATIPGTSHIIDHVYPDRLTHVEELRRMGADIRVTGSHQEIRGGTLHGAAIHGADIRAGAAMIIAALAAQGPSSVDGMVYVERGYEHFTHRLEYIGVNCGKPATMLELTSAMD